jgi:hypothetical protein
MTTRTPIQAADLYVLMQRELRRRQSPQCNTCFVQLPFRVDRASEETPNWEVVMPPSCPFGCRTLIDELIAEFGARYDLKPTSEYRSA